MMRLGAEWLVSSAYKAVTWMVPRDWLLHSTACQSSMLRRRLWEVVEQMRQPLALPSRMKAKWAAV
jgi:hypothetical protein